MLGAQYLYKFFTSANFSMQHENSKYLLDFVEHIVDNAKFYGKKGAKSALLSQPHFEFQRDLSFTNFILAVHQLISKCRSFYKECFGEEVPFILVAHDGWDSVDSDELGVSLHFVDPVEWRMIRIAIGLQVVTKGKTALKQAEQINVILKR